MINEPHNSTGDRMTKPTVGTIKRNYSHRIEADPTTCPVCFGDTCTDDRRFGSEVLYVLYPDHDPRPIYKCEACEVWEDRKEA